MAAWTANSRAQQGLPPYVTDEPTLRQVATLIADRMPADPPVEPRKPRRRAA